MSIHVQRIVAAFSALKFSLPVYGAILLTEAMDKVLLVRTCGARSAWSWPKGKLEKQDHGNVYACAQREVRTTGNLPCLFIVQSRPPSLHLRHV